MTRRGRCSEAKLSRFPESKRIFQRDGRYLRAGRDAGAAGTGADAGAHRGAKAAEDFYEGETARLLAADMAAHGGLITLEDLKNYRVVERQAADGQLIAGYSILTRAATEFGRRGHSANAGRAGGLGITRRSGAGSAAELHFLAEAMRRYFADRAQ